MVRLFGFLLLLANSTCLFASHGMGGEITYKCLGGNTFVFELVFYRDCNGAEVNTVSENLRVWNHPTVSSIALTYISRQDISPKCTMVSGGSIALTCGIGSAGGNGVGAIEKIIYGSAPVVLQGVPPPQGWVFTFENFSRSIALTNIDNPTNYGITLAAKMYAIPGSSGMDCNDSSPIFLQEPYFVSCSGNPFIYNMNAIDPDLDSVHFQFGVPYDRFPLGIYDPPNNPIPVPFESGFSFNSPTPGTALNSANQPAKINPSTGELSFTSFSTGNYAVKITVQSFRRGVKISEVEREMQLVVLSCNSLNSSPVIVAPFPGNSFEKTVNAGDLVSFTLNAEDQGILQDGTSQTLYLSASGPMFGAGLVSTIGCDITPCATLNSLSPISGKKNVSANFSWQTTCNHLVNQYDIVADKLTYNFVFKVQDDYCPVPEVKYATVSIHVVNPGVIPATKIKCIQTDPITKNLTISWNSVNDPNGSFVSYQVRSVQSGLIATVTDINQTSIEIPAPNDAIDYYISVQSGCDGNALKNSDTISNIFLDVTNPKNGTALIQWNKPFDKVFNTYGTHYRLFREYPKGNFTLLDSLDYNTTNYRDTIDICEAFLSYKILFEGIGCEFVSNIDGDNFEDMLTPAIPIIISAGVDTTNDSMRIQWNVNSQPDTYGYVIYKLDENGILFELDTVWGRTNTSYSYVEDLSKGPFSYSVAAFDSCYTTSLPVTYQTSAKGSIHTTMISKSFAYMCEKKAVFSWSKYIGQSVKSYRIWSKNQGKWSVFGTTSDTTMSVSLEQGQTYCFYVESIFTNGTNAFSSPSCFTIPKPGLPAYHYFKLVTVNDGKVELFDYIDSSVGISTITFERKKYNGEFEKIGSAQVESDVVLFVDDEVNLDSQPWEYRTKYRDSCGNEGLYANQNTTIFVSATTNEYDLINYIQWTPYLTFDGGVLEYRIYRGVDGKFNSIPIAIVANNVFNYEDDVSDLLTNGQICYRVEAIEGLNSYNFFETSRSNDFCINYTPLVFVPNAFTPGGVNPVFKPILTNVPIEEYKMKIINRWGQIIFETTDKTDGWNGEILNTGKIATNDTFLYVITFKDENNFLVFKRGYVSIIK
jgi:hypothetical protein